MVDRGAAAIARLTKRDVEALLGAYDADPIRALTVALRLVLEAPSDATWPELVAQVPVSDTGRAALLNGETEALDALAGELNESRELTTS